MESVCPRRRGHEIAALPAASFKNTLAKNVRYTKETTGKGDARSAEELRKVGSVRLVGGGVRIPIKLLRICRPVPDGRGRNTKKNLGSNSTNTESSSLGSEARLSIGQKAVEGATKMLLVVLVAETAHGLQDENFTAVVLVERS